MNRVTQPISKGNKKTFIVLLGWLGAQPRSLRRYESLYRTLLDINDDDNTDVTATTSCIIQTYIAPPYTIVQSVLETPNDEVIRIPFDWPQKQQQQNSSQHNHVHSVQELAWNILRDIYDHTTNTTTTIVNNSDDTNDTYNNKYNDNHYDIYIHAFSNGGCFVWEKIRQILSLPVAVESSVVEEENHNVLKSSSSSSSSSSSTTTTTTTTTNLSDTQSEILLQIRHQLCGIVFDSCPIRDLHRLPDALQYCTIYERLQVFQYCHFNYLSILINPRMKQQVQQRIIRYNTGLQNDTLPIQQLYLYSRDDPLAPSTFIDELVQFRRQRMYEIVMKDDNSCSHRHMDGMISSCVWDKSQHCGHYIHHPVEYTAAIATLLGKHTKENDNSNQKHSILRSKL